MRPRSERTVAARRDAPSFRHYAILLFPFFTGGQGGRWWVCCDDGFSRPGGAGPQQAAPPPLLLIVQCLLLSGHACVVCSRLPAADPRARAAHYYYGGMPTSMTWCLCRRLVAASHAASLGAWLGRSRVGLVGAAVVAWWEREHNRLTHHTVSPAGPAPSAVVIRDRLRCGRSMFIAGRAPATQHSFTTSPNLRCVRQRTTRAVRAPAIAKSASAEDDKVDDPEYLYGAQLNPCVRQERGKLQRSFLTMQFMRASPCQLPRRNEQGRGCQEAQERHGTVSRAETGRTLGR